MEHLVPEGTLKHLVCKWATFQLKWAACRAAPGKKASEVLSNMHLMVKHMSWWKDRLIMMAPEHPYSPRRADSNHPAFSCSYKWDSLCHTKTIKAFLGWGQDSHGSTMFHLGVSDKPIVLPAAAAHRPCVQAQRVETQLDEAEMEERRLEDAGAQEEMMEVKVDLHSDELDSDLGDERPLIQDRDPNRVNSSLKVKTLHCHEYFNQTKAKNNKWGLIWNFFTWFR